MPKTTRKQTSMQDEDRAFFKAAYQNNPQAKKEMDADMKKLGMTPAQYFGEKSSSKKTGSTRKTTPAKKTAKK